jgi:hypothetical protein
MKPEDLCPEAWRRTLWATSALGILLLALLVATAAYVRYGIDLR